MPRVAHGALYLDAIQTNAAPLLILLINRTPEPNDVGVLKDTAIALTILATTQGDPLNATTKVYVQVNADPETLVFSQVAVPPFHASWASSTFVATSSHGSAVLNEHRFVLDRATDFASLDLVKVRVEASTPLASYAANYTFTVQDLTVPAIVSVASRGLRTLRVLYSEPMRNLGDLARGDVLRVRDVSGAVELAATVPGLLPGTEVRDPARVRAPGGAFTQADVGLVLQLDRTLHAANTGRFVVASLVDAQTVLIAGALVTEGPSRDVRASLSGYELEGTQDPARIVPVYSPRVISAKLATLTAAEIAANQFGVELGLDAPLSPGRSYTLRARDVADARDNVAALLSSTFTAEGLVAPRGRSFSALDMVPRGFLRDDTTRDLERLLRCFDEALSHVLSGVDGMQYLWDPDRVPDGLLDAYLAHLGNPFSFAAELNDLEKRKLAKALVDLYKRKGTAKSMIDAIRLVLGITVKIDDFGIPGDTWVLGASNLGAAYTSGGVPIGGSILGPSTGYLRFAFEVEVPSALSARQDRILKEIVNWAKPAPSHLARIVVAP